jgi:antitoxin HicB
MWLARAGGQNAPACIFLLLRDYQLMKKAKKVYAYQIYLVAEKEGGYTVLVPLLPGCVSYGRTVEEATHNAEEAIQLHLTNLAAHRQPIPEGNESVSIFTTLVHVAASHV